MHLSNYYMTCIQNFFQFVQKNPKDADPFKKLEAEAEEAKIIMVSNYRLILTTISKTIVRSQKAKLFSAENKESK